ncbi:MAG: hypothetical protein M3325_10760 [Actinomycetota bacterium]|nr:hypothetical protein [Actinomycetota bacterium]
MVQDRFDIDPRRAGHQPDQDPAEAQPVIDSRAMTTQRVGINRGWEQRLEGRQDGIYHLGLERAHDDGYLHQVVG